MGNCAKRNNYLADSSQLQYSIEVEGAKPGQTAVFRHPITKDGLMYTPREDIKVLRDVFVSIVNRYPTNLFLGTRLISHGNKYSYKTYLEVYDLAKLIGSGIINQNLFYETEPCEITGFKLKIFGIFAKNREEWIIIDLACALYGFTLVPFYDTLGPASIPYILDQTKLTSIFCSAQSIDTLLQTNDLGNLKNIISFDMVSQDTQEKIAARGIKLYQYLEIEAFGQKKKVAWEDVSIVKEQPFTFSYTSGTTGNPKGALLTNTNMTSLISILTYSGVKFDIFTQQITVFSLRSTDVYLSYLPLPHIYERAIAWMVIHTGGAIAFYSGDILKIVDDLQEVKPTFFASVPRLYNRIYAQIQEGINKLSGAKKMLTQKAIEQKIFNFKTFCIYTHVLYDKIIFKKMRDIFGGRIRFMVTTSAPISETVITFLKIALSCPIMELYGQTESSGGSFISKHEDVISGHVGGPTVNTETKLIDIPDMNYFSTDPKPRGEICFRGPGVFAGYYKDKEKTQEALDKDGWLHSGDVGELQPNGSMKIIDRIKNIFKLAQGEYVAAEKIENCYLRAKGVQEIFIYGDSLQHYLVAIIVPIQKYIEEFAKSNNMVGTFPELCKKQEVMQLMMANLVAQAKYDQLTGFEQPKAIYLECESFMNFGILTASMKIKRNDAKKYYAKTIEYLYEQPIQSTQQKAK